MKGEKVVDTLAKRQTRIELLSIFFALMATTLAVAAWEMGNWTVMVLAIIMYSIVPMLGMMYCMMKED